MDITEIYRLISIIGYSLAALLLILSIAIFFLYDIKGVYSYLTGKKKQKGISELRENQSSTKKSGKLKKPFTQPPKKVETRQREEAVAPPQQVQAPPQPAYSPVQHQEQSNAHEEVQAAVQREYGETAPLQQNPKEQAQVEDFSAQNNTVVLNQNEQVSAQEENYSVISSTVGKFVIIKNEMVIHTTEVL